VVISLTTIPKRISSLGKTLQSLRNQLRKPDEIYLGLPNQDLHGRPIVYDRKKIPQDIQIISLEKDYGPVCKLLAGLQAEKYSPDTLIVTVDDDVIYPKEFLTDLLESKETGAVSFGGACCSRLPPFVQVQTTLFGKTPGFVNRLIEFDCFDKARTPRSVDWLLGTAGVRYQRYFFKDDFMELIQQWTSTESMFRADDVMISGYLSMNGIPRHLIYPKMEILKPQQRDQNLPEALSANLFGALKNHLDTYFTLKHKYHAFDCQADTFCPSILTSWVLVILLFLYLVYKIVR